MLFSSEFQEKWGIELISELKGNENHLVISFSSRPSYKHIPTHLITTTPIYSVHFKFKLAEQTRSN